MRMDISGRQSGKTHKMVEWLKDTPDAIMIVFSDAEMNRLRDLHDPDRDREIWNRIVSARAYAEKGGLSFFRPKIGIDDAEFVLQTLLGDVQYVTMTHGSCDDCGTKSHHD